MKYLKKYKLFETGEWSSNVDWEFVKENPDNDSEEAEWIKAFAEDLKYFERSENTKEMIALCKSMIKNYNSTSNTYTFASTNKMLWLRNLKIWMDNDEEYQKWCDENNMADHKIASKKYNL